MKHLSYRFSTAVVDHYLAAGMSQLKKIVDRRSAILLTDEHVFASHTAKFKGWNTIVLKAGEAYKVQATADAVIEQLIGMEADRKTTLVGVGGGVITDITGYIASIYMRGIPFGFIPTSILAMADASIGGKNGIDIGVYKNMVGLIRQPSFILHDLSLLGSLPQAEWENGFAEIIKHACIRDAALFRELEAGSLAAYQRQKSRLAMLVERNVMIKSKIVQRDEFEKGERRLLNFGHTLGHALENQYELSHGQAVAIGMTYACHLSAELAGFTQTERVTGLLGKYKLPTYASFNKRKAMKVLRMDKKRERSVINYILLEKIGKGIVQPVPVDRLEAIIMAI